MASREERHIDVLNILVLTGCAIVLGHKSLIDVDLGWHLAGGLWILNHHTVPMLDPFATPAATWIDYSWLFQSFIAAVFRIGGFLGLQYLQTVLIVFSVLGLWFLVKQTLIDFAPIVRSTCATLAVLYAMFFIAPVWHLRPQLISVIFFCALLWLIRRNSFVPIVVLTILWANIHVYWVLVPTIVLLDGFLHAKDGGGKQTLSKAIAATLVTTLAGLVSPYGIKNIICIWQYLSENSVAYQLVREFQPLAPSHGLVFWLFLISICLPVVFSQMILAHGERLSVALLPITAVMAFMRIKYLPLYGVIFALVFSRTIAPRIFRRLSSAERNSSPLIKVTAALLTITFLAVVIDGLGFHPPLSERYAEIFQAAEVVTQNSANQEKPAVVLNHFDDGGWIALAAELEAERHGTELQVRTTYDGRTLVMGDDRLRDFNRLQFMKEGWCEIVRKTGATFAILPAEMELTSALLNNECGSEWKLIFEGDAIYVIGKI